MGTTLTASTIFFHAVNNYFQNIGGHAFDIDKNTYVLMAVTTLMTSGSTTAGGATYDVITVAEAGACTSYTGYICEWNKAYSSGTLYDIANVAVLSKASQYKSYLVGHTAVADVPANVKANARIGNI